MRLKDQMAENTVAFVLAGGAGRRLNPLTKYRPKPLVPFGGCFRILDFTLSNCLNSGFNRAYVLTQHQSDAIAAYLEKGWSRFETSCDEFAIPVRAMSRTRYAGTADAIFQNVRLLHEHQCRFALVVSADHVYKMDYRNLLSFHASTGAEVTIATVEHPKECASEMGVLQIDNERVVGFQEKPPNGYAYSKNGKTVTVNMGVYVFNYETLLGTAQTNNGEVIDIGADLIPRLLHSHKVNAYRHQDGESRKPLYWRDVGTLQAYYDASMDLLVSRQPIDPYENSWPIRSENGVRQVGRNGFSQLHPEIGMNSIVPDTADVADACVYRSVLSAGVVLESGVDVEHSVILPGAVIRRGTAIRRAIIDANVVIEADDRIGYDSEEDQRRFHVLPNGIVVVSPDYLVPCPKLDRVKTAEPAA
jgi:glucose-1-phosphate adenylyltransferase